MTASQIMLTYNNSVVVGANVIAAIMRTSNTGSPNDSDSYLDLTDLGDGADPMAVLSTALRLQ